LIQTHYQCQHTAPHSPKQINLEQTMELSCCFKVRLESVWFGLVWLGLVGLAGEEGWGFVWIAALDD
jgi:hypothetical protein